MYFPQALNHTERPPHPPTLPSVGRRLVGGLKKGSGLTTQKEMLVKIKATLRNAHIQCCLFPNLYNTLCPPPPRRGLRARGRRRGSRGARGDLWATTALRGQGVPQGVAEKRGFTSEGRSNGLLKEGMSVEVGTGVR